jgi:hypothetical protein
MNKTYGLGNYCHSSKKDDNTPLETLIIPWGELITLLGGLLPLCKENITIIVVLV